jgi:outer membrane autotransporter protein
MIKLAARAFPLLLLGIASANAADMPVKARPLAAPAWAPVLSLYTFFDVISYRSAFPGREFHARAYQSLTGFNYTVTPDWTVGAGIIYSYSKADLDYLGPAAFSRTDSLQGFVSTSYNIPNLFTIGGSAGWGQAWTYQERLVNLLCCGVVRSTAEYDADTWFASGFVSRTFQSGNWFVTPTVRVLARESAAEGYIESTGIINAALTSRSFEVDYGGQVSYAIPAAGGWVFYPTVQAFGLHYFELPLFQTDRDGVDLKVGASATVGPWSMGAFYMTILGIDAYRDYHGGRFFLAYNFGGSPPPGPIEVSRVIPGDRPLPIYR